MNVPVATDKRRGDPAFTALRSDNAREYVPVDGDALTERPAGPTQGLAFELGLGRVVVLGEGAMMTAQVNRRVAYGMNTTDKDNQQFALNVMHWLSRKL